jgi:hypothetical protein
MTWWLAKPSKLLCSIISGILMAKQCGLTSHQDEPSGDFGKGEEKDPLVLFQHSPWRASQGEKRLQDNSEGLDMLL